MLSAEITTPEISLLRIPGFGNTSSVEFIDKSMRSFSTYFAMIVAGLVQISLVCQWSWPGGGLYKSKHLHLHTCRCRKDTSGERTFTEHLTTSEELPMSTVSDPTTPCF